jgi:hypothetical protein
MSVKSEDEEELGLQHIFYEIARVLEKGEFFTHDLELVLEQLGVYTFNDLIVIPIESLQRVPLFVSRSHAYDEWPYESYRREVITTLIALKMFCDEIDGEKGTWMDWKTC